MKQLILIFMLFGGYCTMQAQTVVTIDFTDPATPTWGTNATMNVGGVMMLQPGDANGDKRVTYNGAANDRNSILNVVGLFTPNLVVSGYYPQDVNMDGRVTYNGAANDRNIVLNTVGLFTPNLVKQEQIP